MLRLSSVVVTFLFAVPAFAQKGDPEFEFSVFVGHNFIDVETFGVLPLGRVGTEIFPPIQSGSFEGGLELGVRFGYLLHPRFTLEAAYQYAPNNTLDRADFIILEVPPAAPGEQFQRIRFDYGLTRQDADSHRVTANLLYRLTARRLSPFVTAGLGAEVFDLSSDATRTNFTWNLGGGIQYRLREGLAARFDAREVFIPDFFATRKTEIAVELQVALVIGF